MKNKTYLMHIKLPKKVPGKVPEKSTGDPKSTGI
jgi:hypothetical protein